MDIILIPILKTASFLLTLYTYALVAYIAVNLLLNFKIINPSNQLARTLMDFLYRILDPVLSKIRSIIPFVGPFDLSPLILLLSIFFIQNILARLFLSLIKDSIR